jgi:hypothetical protein
VAKSQFNVIYRKVPELLVKLREESGRTQRQLAAKLGKTQSWVFDSQTAFGRMIKQR